MFGSNIVRSFGGMREITLQELSAHNTRGDCWLAIDGHVYDVSSFAAMHPGGRKVIEEWGGKDATQEFYSLHRFEVLQKYSKRLVIAKIAGTTRAIPHEDTCKEEISKVPYAENSFWRGFHSPYYNDSHYQFRSVVRKFIEREIKPEAERLNRMGKPASKSVMLKMGQAGYIAAKMGPGKHLDQFTDIGGIKPCNFDRFHELILNEEFARIGYPGYIDGLGSGTIIGLPPVMAFGSKSVKKLVVQDVLMGEKSICLAISEPFAGSDVAGLRATAVKTPDGKHFVVNGLKKWITNGVHADFFVVAVRTGRPGMDGISVLLIERGEGVKTTPIATSYSPSAGTAYIEFEDVLVPVDNLLGQENGGFMVIMSNFNHERWSIIAGVLAAMRVGIQEVLQWTHQREAFGKALIHQPVIRNKLALMIARTEGLHNWLENLTYQMSKMSVFEQAVQLAGSMALLKLESTRALAMIVDECCQIFGGRAVTKSGMGKLIEEAQRAVKFYAIYGGSEEVMGELGVKQAMRMFPRGSKL